MTLEQLTSLAGAAGIDLAGADTQTLLAEMNTLTEFVEALPAVAATPREADSSAPLRPDEVAPSLPREALLGQSANARGAFYTAHRTGVSGDDEH